MKHDVRVDHQPVALLGGKLGVQSVTPFGQHRLEPGIVCAEVTFLKTTRNVITDISLSKDYRKVSMILSAGPLRSQFRTFPLAVFLRNLVCERGRSALVRLRMVIGGCGFDDPAMGGAVAAMETSRMSPAACVGGIARL
jgi:hypothetical protein